MFIGSRHLSCESQASENKSAVGKVIFFIFKNIFRFFFLYVLKENSTCAQASWSVLSISRMLCAAVVQCCHGNCPLYFFGGPEAFGLHILCVECNSQKTGRWGWGGGGGAYRVQVEQLIFEWTRANSRLYAYLPNRHDITTGVMEFGPRLLLLGRNK